jgi:hypothetical protein
LAKTGYQLKTGQNSELAGVFLYHKLMTKKTEQHKTYAQLANRLSLYLPPLANKVFASSLKSLIALKAALIGIFRQNSGAISIRSPVYGKRKSVVPG